MSCKEMGMAGEGGGLGTGYEEEGGGITSMKKRDVHGRSRE